MVLFTYFDRIKNANLGKKFDSSSNLISPNEIYDTHIEETYVTHTIPMIPEISLHDLEQSARYALHLILEDNNQVNF